MYSVTKSFINAVEYATLALEQDIQEVEREIAEKPMQGNANILVQNVLEEQRQAVLILKNFLERTQ